MGGSLSSNDSNSAMKDDIDHENNGEQDGSFPSYHDRGAQDQLGSYYPSYSEIPSHTQLPLSCQYGTFPPQYSHPNGQYNQNQPNQPYGNHANGNVNPLQHNNNPAPPQTIIQFPSMPFGMPFGNWGKSLGWGGIGGANSNSNSNGSGSKEGSGGGGFLESYFFLSLLTSAIVVLILYKLNPPFIQKDSLDPMIIGPPSFTKLVLMALAVFFFFMFGPSLSKGFGFGF